MINKIGGWLVAVLKVIIVLVIPNIFGIVVSFCFFGLINVAFIRNDIPIGLKIILTIILLLAILIFAMLYISFFKSSLETHKLKNESSSGSNNSTEANAKYTLNCIYWLQICLSFALYMYITYLVFNLLGFISLTILLPIFLMIYSIIWSPSRSEN